MNATDRAAALELAREVLSYERLAGVAVECRTTYDVSRVLARALLAAEAERERLHRGLTDLTEYDCEYGDNCPVFGSRHGACFGCRARRVLAYATKSTTDTERPLTIDEVKSALAEGRSEREAAERTNKRSPRR